MGIVNRLAAFAALADTRSANPTNAARRLTMPI